MPFKRPTNRAEFDNFLIKSEKIIIVYFTSSNDNHQQCKKVADMLETLDKSHPGNTFVEVDVDKFKDIAHEYQILAVPAIFVFQDGERIFEEQHAADADIETTKDQLVTRFLDVK